VIGGFRSRRVVSASDGIEKARNHNVMFVETSAKTKQGIVSLFDQLIEAIIGEDEGVEGTGTQQNAEKGTRDSRDMPHHGGAQLGKNNVEEKPVGGKKKCCGKA